ncbi:MFS transporter [Naumannella sp. ID2617S]|nr:MFS transporter [Naumannella sp. ID2617S]
MKPALHPPPSPCLVRIGGAPFLITAAVGRMPAAMIQLGMLLFVTRSGGGLALAGLTVAALGVGSAVGAPVVGRLVDRFGPLRILLGCTAVQVACMTALIQVVGHQLPTLLLAALLGGANPQVAAVARSRWTRLVRDHGSTAPAADRLMGRALGYESAMDEVSFVLGPAVGGALIGGLGARPGLLAVIAITVLGQGAFAGFLIRHPTPAGGGSGRGPLPWLRMLLPLAAGVAVGTAFGATQTGLTAHFEATGRPGLTGAVYALVGVGSAIASLLAGRLPGALWPRMLAGGAILTGGALTMAYASALPLLALGALVVGIGVGPLLVSGFTLVERAAPRGSLTTAMTAMATATVVGVALGAAVGARLDEALLLTAGAGCFAALLGVLARRSR